MRFLLLTAAALLPQASAAALADSPAPAAEPATIPALERSSALAQPKCRKPTSYNADVGSWREAPVKPQKLNELPAAQGYMAVYRTIEGCEVPMTVTEYRTGRRP